MRTAWTPGMLLGLVAVLAVPVRAWQMPTFHDEEMLHNPTPTSVTLTLVPAEECELYVEYGAGRKTQRTLMQHARAGRMAAFALDGLEPDGQYTYRVHARLPGQAPWQPRESHVFRTLRSPGSTFSFAVIADSHAFSVWSKKFCEQVFVADEFTPLKRTLENVRDDPTLDFVIAGTDNAMTVCGAGCKPCNFGDQGTTSAQSVDGLTDALLRYRTVLSPEIYGIFGPDLPMLYMLGDHDGEKGWGVSGSCASSEAMTSWSKVARSRFLPNPHAAYGPALGGDKTGNYYAVETGDVLLVILDPARYTTEPPLGPEDHTLGARQLHWLDRTLARSKATFKVVFSEHVLGGISSSVCWKGRGALKSTANSEINGPFLGEQNIIHEILKQHRAQVFFSFHDHVVVWGEKVDANFVGEGVTYVTGGRASGISNAWSNESWYQTAMDYDNDGVPEYMTDVTGTRSVGHFKVTVHGNERVEFDYMQSTGASGQNGQKLLGFTIQP